MLRRPHPCAAALGAVTVVGSEAEHVSTYTIRLKHCRVVPQASAPAPREAAAPAALPVNPPAGEYASGPLRGFGGLYYTRGRNANGPTIALSATGAVTDLEGRANGAYQFAFFRPGGVR